MGKRFEREYDGTLYRAVGNVLGERYLEYGFTQGTVADVDFVAEVLDLPSGARILDVGCGPGRHSLELQRRGFMMTGIDISDRFIEIATEKARAENLSATFLQGDARCMRFQEPFDGAICLCEGAFGLAGSDEGHARILERVHAALKPGGRFVLSAINAFGVVQKSPSPDVFDPYTAVATDVERILGEDGAEHEATLHTTTFTFRELRWLAERVGLEVDEGYGGTAGRLVRKPLTIHDMEIVIVAHKPA